VPPSARAAAARGGLARALRNPGRATRPAYDPYPPRHYSIRVSAGLVGAV